MGSSGTRRISTLLKGWRQLDILRAIPLSSWSLFTTKDERAKILLN
jgi:hypothetical protein